MMMNRITSRCLNVQIHEMRLGLVDHWDSAGMPRETALAFMAAAARRQLKPRMLYSKQTREVPVWCVLPYHPIWMKLLSKALRIVNSDNVLLCMACRDWKHLCLKPSWSNFLPPMTSRVMSAGGRGRLAGNLTCTVSNF